jgi:hypothetical protein
MIALSDVQGLWRRSLMAWPDGRRDTTTAVTWMQAPTLFGDLRVPAQQPDFSGSSCRNDLSLDQVRWLATQAGFAGRLAFDGTYFEWHRTIDYQPQKANPDAARLWFENGMLVEEGRYSPYIEHWHRDGKVPQSASSALRLTDLDTGVAGLLVYVDQHFMYARDRAQKLTPGGTLGDLVASAPPDDARGMIDCEISFGRITQTHWRIESSSLPYRESAELLPSLSKDMTHFTSADIQADGTPMTRRWSVVEIEGDITHGIKSPA